MATHKIDPDILAHLEWIGFVRPTGLVVSAPALVRAGAILNRRDAEGQRLLAACLADRTFDPKVGPIPHLPDFPAFAKSVLGWSFSPKGYAGTPDSPIPPELEITEQGETLRPDFAVREMEPKENATPWQLLVRVLPPGEDFDHITRQGDGLEASAHGRMERLLRRTGVLAGLLFNGRSLRLVSAPRAESSGWLDVHVADMAMVAGRPICTALRLLLGQSRLLALPRHQRLTALLEDSRKFQNEVSERLAEQVLHALYELVRGFQAANDASKGELLRDTLDAHPDEVYRALLTVLLRLVFVLYAEERDMLPEDDAFLQYYALGGLYDRLREDAALYPDTMDQRYGAWAQLLVLFRMIHDGAAAGPMRLPRRHGVLFDPNRYPFLEGRSAALPPRPPAGGEGRGEGGELIPFQPIDVPLVPDGTLYRALEKLLVLDGERISYRALDVEQIGSVYETMMGFRLETATGRSVAIKAQKKGGAPTTVDLDALLAEAPAKREKWMQDRAARKLTEKVKKAVKEAATLEDLHAALLPVADTAATPDLVPRGAMALQPSEERRKSGSHYTPRALTQPIVKTTLEPIFQQLGDHPTPQQILDLKVCDPAMGSGAFLVEACRQLGDALLDAWRFHGGMPEIPPDEDEILFARRLVAQRCLYGVDKNPVAVDLAKVSLWLATLAKDHPFTFLDHSLRCGDSLVGLTRRQIEGFHWKDQRQAEFAATLIQERLEEVISKRLEILAGGDNLGSENKRQLLDVAESKLELVRFIADGPIAAFFAEAKDKERKRKRDALAADVHTWLSRGLKSEDHLTLTNSVDSLRGARGIIPFHWEIEFPEAFIEKAKGFDAVITNPPFVDSETMTRTDPQLREYIATVYACASGNWDLYIPFFERAISICRNSATLISPNKWLGAPYGSALRENTKLLISRIFDFSESRAFPDVGVAAICSVFRKTPTPQITISKSSSNTDIDWDYTIPRSMVEHSTNWGFFLSDHLDLIIRLKSNQLRFQTYIDASDPFTVSEAYELIPIISEANSAHPDSYFKFINTGTIDPFINYWGRSELTYLKNKFLRPVIGKSELREMYPRRYEQAVSPKVVISGMRKFEAFLDEKGEYVAGKSTILVISKYPNLSLLTCVGIFNSKLMRFFIQECFGVLGVDGGISFSGSIVKDLPLPRAFAGQLVDVDTAVAELLSIGNNKGPAMDQLLSKLDEAVFDAYEISADMRHIILGYEFKC